VTQEARGCGNNIVNHEGCTHGGWREVSWPRESIPVVNAARDAADYAARDLGLDRICIRPKFPYSPAR
jgi:hypothetical protein